MSTTVASTSTTTLSRTPSALWLSAVRTGCSAETTRRPTAQPSYTRCLRHAAPPTSGSGNGSNIEYVLWRSRQGRNQVCRWMTFFPWSTRSVWMPVTGIFRIPTDQAQVEHTQISGKKPILVQSSGFLLLFSQTSNTRETIGLL